MILPDLGLNYYSRSFKCNEKKDIYTHKHMFISLNKCKKDTYKGRQSSLAIMEKGPKTLRITYATNLTQNNTTDRLSY